MLTPDQKKWIDHLPNDNQISIVPYDPSAEEKFEEIRRRVQAILGKKTRVEHRGATSLKISGQDEIDVYIPVPTDDFDSLLDLLKKIFGEPGSVYPLDRARFVTEIDGKKIEVFLINNASPGWLNGVKFEKYLKSHPKALDAYKKLKEEAEGVSTREYYQRKIEFINYILAKAD